MDGVAAWIQNSFGRNPRTGFHRPALGSCDWLSFRGRAKGTRGSPDPTRVYCRRVAVPMLHPIFGSGLLFASKS
jgi:hypothetical protein